MMDKNQAKLTFLLLSTLLPIIAATLFFRMMSENGVSRTSNNGVLIHPVLDLVSLQLTINGTPAYKSFDELTYGVRPADYQARPWQLLYMTSTGCDDICMDRLQLLRQIHIRLGRESDRVERVLVNISNYALDTNLKSVLQTKFPAMRLLHGDPSILTQILSPSAGDQDPVKAGYIYVADPVGNVMLYFTPENNPEQILSDLDKLLGRSSLG
jgi:hypothetical protein